MGKPRVLYISYDGMLEPLGQSQVIAYLERLAGDYTIHLLSFEKPADRARANSVSAIAARLKGAGITWHPLTYHKSPTLPATVFDIVQGFLVSLWLAARHNIGLVHARSYIPALIGWVVKLLTGASLLFDMRGLWADERADGGIWPAGGQVYRAVKRLERTLLQGADHVVTLTHASKATIAAFPYRVNAPVSVIPTCADLDRFTPGQRAADAPFTFGYVGSAGTRYAFDEVLQIYQIIRQRRAGARLLIVNRNDHALITERLPALGNAAGAVELLAAEPGEVPGAIRRMHAAAAFYQPLPSAVACAPTKLAEYLGCGVPCLGNVGVGDMEQILEGECTGVVLREFIPEERSRAVDRLLALTDDPATPARCRKVALTHFSVDDGAKQYRAIYRSLVA